VVSLLMTDLNDLAQRINAVMDDPANAGLTIDQLAEKFGITDRVKFKQTIVAAQAAWAEAASGIDCRCGGKAAWAWKKRTFSENGQGFDVFPFVCTDCGTVIERKWRAPSLDGETFEAYVTTYKRKEDGMSQMQ
jgi:hypothetical protein